jgi:hypothetical protein
MDVDRLFNPQRAVLSSGGAVDPASIELLYPSRHIGCEAHAVGGVAAPQVPHHLVRLRELGVPLRRHRLIAAMTLQPQL